MNAPIKVTPGDWGACPVTSNEHDVAWIDPRAGHCVDCGQSVMLAPVPALCHPVGAPDAACHGCGAPDRRTLDRDAPAIVEHGDGGYRVRAGLTRHPRVFGLLEVARRYAYAHNAANGHATTPADMREGQ